MPQQFPLQKVLDHRQQIEEQRQAQVALAELRLEQAQATAQLAQSRRDVVLADLNALKSAQAVDGISIMAAYKQLDRAEAAVLLACENARVAAAAVATARSTAVVASQDRVVIERLHDQFHLAARRASERAEGERLGELSLIRWQTQQRRE
jgi:hypothetical protein